MPVILALEKGRGGKGWGDACQEMPHRNEDLSLIPRSHGRKGETINKSQAQWHMAVKADIDKAPGLTVSLDTSEL